LRRAGLPKRSPLAHGLADALHVVADEAVEGECLPRVELEVREDDQEVVVVSMGLVETQRDRDAGVVVRDTTREVLVVVGAVVLDDDDVADVAESTGEGGERRRLRPRPELRGPFLAQGPEAVESGARVDLVALRKTAREDAPEGQERPANRLPHRMGEETHPLRLARTLG
jgi:hypothetical protein